MGLVICESIAVQYNGQVGVNSVYGQGSKFMFSLEIGEVDDKVGNRNLYDAHDALMNSEQVRIIVGKFKNYVFDFTELTPHMLELAQIKL